MKHSPTVEYSYHYLLNRLYNQHEDTKSVEQKTAEKFGQPPEIATPRNIYKFLENNELNLANPRPKNLIINVLDSNKNRTLAIEIPSKNSAFEKI
jgi:hypothetical protein